MRELIVIIALAFSSTGYAQAKATVNAKARMCRAAKDCKGPLPEICERCGADGRDRCAHWACVTGRCETEICPPAAPAPPQCKAAGDCKGPIPEICMECGAKNECAHWACAAGKCEVQICPPASPECKVATDCKGPLPQLCEQCSSGKEACAHWACAAGKCETQICP